MFHFVFSAVAKTKALKCLIQLRMSVHQIYLPLHAVKQITCEYYIPELEV